MPALRCVPPLCVADTSVCACSCVWVCVQLCTAGSLYAGNTCCTGTGTAVGVHMEARCACVQVCMSEAWHTPKGSVLSGSVPGLIHYVCSCMTVPQPRVRNLCLQRRQLCMRHSAVSVPSLEACEHSHRAQGECSQPCICGTQLSLQEPDL